MIDGGETPYDRQGTLHFACPSCGQAHGLLGPVTGCRWVTCTCGLRLYVCVRDGKVTSVEHDPAPAAAYGYAPHQPIGRDPFA